MYQFEINHYSAMQKKKLIFMFYLEYPIIPENPQKVFLKFPINNLTKNCVCFESNLQPLIMVLVYRH